jgi:hypothetical protein
MSERNRRKEGVFSRTGAPNDGQHHNAQRRHGEERVETFGVLGPGSPSEPWLWHPGWDDVGDKQLRGAGCEVREWEYIVALLGLTGSRPKELAREQIT